MTPMHPLLRQSLAIETSAHQTTWLIRENVLADYIAKARSKNKPIGKLQKLYGINTRDRQPLLALLAHAVEEIGETMPPQADDFLAATDTTQADRFAYEGDVARYFYYQALEVSENKQANLRSIGAQLYARRVTLFPRLDEHYSAWLSRQKAGITKDFYADLPLLQWNILQALKNTGLALRKWLIRLLGCDTMPLPALEVSAGGEYADKPWAAPPPPSLWTRFRWWLCEKIRDKNNRLEK